MKEYEITIALKNKPEDFDDFCEKYFEAIEDGPMPSLENNIIILDDVVEANNAKEAYDKSIEIITNSNIGLEIHSIIPGDIVSQSEISNRWGIKRQNINNWCQNEKSFPLPVNFSGECLKCYYSFYEVSVWIYKNKKSNSKKTVEEIKDIIETAEYIKSFNSSQNKAHIDIDKIVLGWSVIAS